METRGNTFFAISAIMYPFFLFRDITRHMEEEIL